jgi:hypothetical protein
MKKYMMMAAAAVLVLASCNNASQKMDEQPTAVDNTPAGGLKIAFVEVDSLMTQYDFAKDYSVTDATIAWGGNAGDDNTQNTGIDNSGATGDGR